MLFRFVKSISQFFSKFFQHRLFQPQGFRGVRMKYSMLFSFVKSKIHFFQDFFSTAPSTSPSSGAMGHKYTTLFPFVKPDSEKIFDFPQNASLGSELTHRSKKNKTYRPYRTYKSYFLGAYAKKITSRKYGRPCPCNAASRKAGDRACRCGNNN